MQTRNQRAFDHNVVVVRPPERCCLPAVSDDDFFPLVTQAHSQRARTLFPQFDRGQHARSLLRLPQDLIENDFVGLSSNGGDVDLAHAIPNDDDEVDALYLQVYRELLTLMMANPSTIDQATYLLWAAHNLERAADRVTNICERVVFTVTGEMAEMDVREGDTPLVESLG